MSTEVPSNFPHIISTYAFLFSTVHSVKIDHRRIYGQNFKLPTNAAYQLHRFNQ
jgi:hypothetical protein